MPLIETENELRTHLSSILENKVLGLVPTMGALHKGHASLIKKAVSENDFVVVTIFVNPTQFDNQEDLKKYPKTLEADQKLIHAISDAILIFAPSVGEMYRNEVQSKVYDFGGLENVMEGAFRDGHFDGVGTIVSTLLKMVQPTNAYFGEKDFQQLQIIRKLVEIEKLDVTIVGCPIVREANGLAMSSRNERLPKALRQEASFIYDTLVAAKQKFGTKSANDIEDWVTEQFEKHPDLRLEYMIITDVDRLLPVTKKQQNKKYRAFIAVYANEVRLIDNIALN